MTATGKRRRDVPPPRVAADEKPTLLAFLDSLRESVAAKLDGVPEPDVRTPGVPSGTHLLGLVWHLAHVERFVFLGEDAADWPATFRPGAEQTVEDVLAAYRAAAARANAAIAACSDLTEPLTWLRPPASMRWALTHMVEETARHAGHADILRERIDGATGR